jgi:heme exporter protein A
VSSLELLNLECRRGGRSLFTGLSRQVDDGSLLRVEGPNGAGKTSLLRTVCGLVPPAQGQVRWRGKTLSAWGTAFNQQLVYLGHAPALKDDLSAIENLQAALSLGGTAVSPEQADATLAETGLTQRTQVPVRALSQGQRKRVALARLPLSAWAPLWVLDEPFNALDTAASAWLVDTLTKHLQQGGIVVLTSHQSVTWNVPVSELSIAL